MPPLVGCAVVDHDQGDVSNDDTQPVGNDGQKAGDQIQLVLLLALHIGERWAQQGLFLYLLANECALSDLSCLSVTALFFLVT